MPTPPVCEPIRLVNVPLVLWAVAVAALSAAYLPSGRQWVWAGFAVAAITAGLGIWGLRSGQWIRPLFASLYVLAIGCVAAGPLTDLDAYPVAGIVCLTVLSVGATIVHQLGRRT